MYPSPPPSPPHFQHFRGVCKLACTCTYNTRIHEYTNTRIHEYTNMHALVSS